MSSSAPSIYVQIESGPRAGTGLVFDHSPITFGRDPQNAIVLDLHTASRRHGELRYEAGRWEVVNHSANVLTVNGRKVARKPRSLPSHAVIAIGDYPIMQTSLTPADEPGQPSEAGSAGRAVVDAPAASGMTGRHKLWIGIGVYLLLMLGLFVFFSTLNSSETDDTTTMARELTAEAIRAEIRRSPAQRPPDARRAREARDEARELFALAEVEVDALYRAHEAYKQAIAYTRGDVLEDPTDQRRFNIIQRRLADEVIERYSRGINMLRSRQYDVAAREFQQLVRFYPDPQSELFRNAQQHWDHARQQME